MTKKRKKTIYALYRGDEFIDVGTADELAKKRNINTRVIIQMASKSHHARSTDGTVLSYRIK